MQGVKYDHSSVHVRVPDAISDQIIQWGREAITDDDIFVSQRDPTFGREDEIHVTVLYGIHSETAEEVREIMNQEQPVKVRLGKVQIFTNPFKFDVVVVNVISHDLRKLNKKLTDKVEYTNRYGKYHPHVTVAYVKKGKGWKHNEFAQWAGQEFVCDHVVFSSKNGTKERIALQ
jgi:2'-5' RNA ligase